MPALTKIAPVTRLGRINRHSRPSRQPRYSPVDDPRKLVANDQRRFELGVANARIEIGVEIAAANAGCRNANKNLPSPQRRRRSDVFNAQVTRAMESGGQHLQAIRFRVRLPGPGTMEGFMRYTALKVFAILPPWSLPAGHRRWQIDASASA